MRVRGFPAGMWSFPRASFGVIGLTYLPDPANRVVQIESDEIDPPVGAPPRPHQGLWTLTSLIRLQRRFIPGLFGE